ncbi:MAG: undecaprenyl-diphosphate phosphatase, partial [Thermoleophilaceae bacterium]|nr:undecaprenyl-diphosphate phosphatase [Thermoleophilaceae bacterium]
MARARWWRALRRRGPARIAASPSRAPELPLRHAAALGGLQGIAELLPISSSGHLTLVPALLGWPYAGMDPELRKSFEVAVHAGSALGLLGTLRRDMRTVVAGEHRANEAVGAALVLAPSLLAGLLLERLVTERASGPRGVAGAQVAAGLAMAAADRRPAARRYGTARTGDHLALGLAQAAALVPGVSRNGSTLTGARLRRFERQAAARLSRQAALPVV